MKIHVLTLCVLIASASAIAKVTEVDVAGDMAWGATQNITVPQLEFNNQWGDHNEPPNEIGKNTIVSTHYAQTRQIQLKPTSSHICVIGRAGGEYHRGLKGINVDVFQSGGYWYLNAAQGTNNNWGSATCWNK